MALPQTKFENEGSIQFPFLKDIYSFYSPIPKNITAWSFGLGMSGIETALVEGTGCKITVFDGRPGKEEEFNHYKQILTTRKPIHEEDTWEQSLSKRWIKAINLQFSSTIPFSYTGTLDISGVQTNVQNIQTDTLNFCKVDYDDFTTNIVYDILSKGYRPGLFLINWKKHPDSFNSTMLCAGHLQTTGYKLLEEKNGWFLYIFLDQCMYETCSWADTTTINPMFEEYKKHIVTSVLANPHSI